MYGVGIDVFQGGQGGDQLKEGDTKGRSSGVGLVGKNSGLIVSE
jgi:hypothetical protein